MQPPTGESLDQLDMIQLAAGHHQALDRLMARHGDRLYRYLLRSLQNEADAADAAQETFVRVYLHRHEFNVSSHFLPWLYTIAGNLVRDRYRWRARHGKSSSVPHAENANESLHDELVDPHSSPEQALLSHERSQAVQDAIGSLPADLKDPLILSVYENLTHSEIASILQCSTKAVEMKIYRARKSLAHRLRRWLDSP